MALLGLLSQNLTFSDEEWVTTIKRNLPEALPETRAYGL